VDRHQSAAEAEVFLNGLVAEHYRGEQLDYGLCLRGAETQLIGGLGVYERSAPHRVAELGYVLAREHWGRGLVPEAVRTQLDHLFACGRFERVYAPIFAENEKSRRAALKMGLRFEGVLRSAYAYRGRRWDSAIYAVLRSDWQGSTRGAP
jgi:ribosomal-protein-alanine N-acetyltransferase